MSSTSPTHRDAKPVRAPVLVTILLVGWMLIIGSLGPAAAVTPGNVQPGVAVPIVLLCIGAYLAAGDIRWLPAFFIYGCLGMLPDAGSHLSRRNVFGATPDWVYVGSVVCLVIGTGVLCRLSAMLRVRIERSRAGWDKSRCQKCGYLLYGLPERRCPECGTEF